MTVRTYSLEQSAAIIVGCADDGSLLPGAVDWLRRRLTGLAEPHLPSYVVARRRRMTQAHIDEALRLLEQERVAVPEVPSLSGMTRTSRRRLTA